MKNIVMLVILLLSAGFMQAEITLDSEDTSQYQDFKTWTISALNSDPQGVTGNSGLSTGVIAGRGLVTDQEFFTVTVEARSGWTTADADAAISSGTLGDYLDNTLAKATVCSFHGGDFDFGVSSFLDGDFRKIENGEALIFRFETTGLAQSTQLSLTALTFGIYGAVDRCDVVVYDASEDAVTVWIQQGAFNGDDNPTNEIEAALGGPVVLENGDLIIFAAVAGDSFRVDDKIGFEVDSALSPFGAHSPTPAGPFEFIPISPYDVTLAWFSPEQDEYGMFEGHPDIVSIDKYQVYYNVNNPDLSGVTPVDNGTAQSCIVPGLKDEDIVTWRVDTTVTFDNDVTEVIEGYPWSFTLTEEVLPISIRWRVIPEDPDFPTEDTVLAAISVTDRGFTNPLPADPANQDCTATFQEALDLVSADDGGVVFVPAGQYRLDGTLNVSSNVTLRGRWREITASQPAAGTIIKVYNGHGLADGTPLITVGSGGGVRDLTFWHPLQDPANITPYPFVLKPSSSTLENITFINAYQGVKMDQSSMCFVDNVEGTILHYGFYADQSAAVSRFENINFGPEVWEWANLPDAAPINTAYRNYMLSNAVGIDIRDMDGWFMSDCKARGLKTGLLLAPSPVNGAGPSGATVSGLDIRDCAVAIEAIGTGISFMNSTLHGTNYAVKTGGGFSCINSKLMGGVSSGDITAAMTTIDGVLDISNGNVQLVDCDFTGSGTDMILGSSVDAIHIVGCTFADGPDIVDNSPGSITKLIDHNPVYGYSAPPDLPPKDLGIIRKPYSTTIFDITDYGAIANDDNDDSLAFGAAVAAANANGGGIVFVPNGIFDVAGSYTFAPGVELRGTSASVHSPTKKYDNIAAVLQVTGNEGNPTGPAFLNLSTDCGVRGITFHYNEQKDTMLIPETIIEYPYAIRGTGDNIYITDTYMSNPYQGIHFYRADNHLVERCKLGSLINTILAEECHNGRIGKFHLKGDFWRDLWIGDIPVGNTKDDIDIYQGKHYTGIWLKDCTHEVVHSIFNHTAHNFVRVDNSSAFCYMTGGEVLQRGFRFSGDRDVQVVHGEPLMNMEGDDTGMYGFWADETFTGTASLWSGYVSGTPGKAYYVQSGRMIAHQVGGPGWSIRGNVNMQVDSGATLKLQMNNPYRKFGCIFAEGSTVSMQDTIMSDMPNTMLTHPSVHTARNIYSRAYISTSPNSGQIVNDGMILDPTNLDIEFSPIHMGSTYSDHKNIKGARTTDGDYVIDIVDPDFANGASKKVNIDTYWKIDTDCTINIYYRSTTNPKKLGQSQTYTGLVSYQSVNFTAYDAQFDGVDDIIIEITGDSPLLNSVNVFRDVSPNIQRLPDLTNDGKVNMNDFAEMSDAWMILYGLDALTSISDNWLDY